MAFTVTDFHDLVRLLEQHPEWRAELRSLVLTEDLLTLPALVRELAEAQRRTEDRVGRLEEAMVALAEAQRRTEEQVSELARIQAQMLTDLGELKGDSLERRYRERAGAYFGSLLRRVRVVTADELDVLLEAGVAAGKLDEAAELAVRQADLIVRGRRRADGREIFLVVEVSWSVGAEDVERAAEQALWLRGLGVEAVGVVAGRTVRAEARELIERMKVWQVIDGRGEPLP